MPHSRSLTFVLLVAAQIGQAALAAPFVAPIPPDASPLIEPVARKGTRAYTAGDEAATLPAVPSIASPSSNDEALDQCLSTWDAGTHISKSKWREICVRQLKENSQ
jgi:hypothetical protein